MTKNTWTQIGWLLASAAAINGTAPRIAPSPETEEKPHWVSEEGEGGHVRDSLNANTTTGVSTGQGTIGHQRPS